MFPFSFKAINIKFSKGNSQLRGSLKFAIIFPITSVAYRGGGSTLD